ncbi:MULTISPECIES: acyltransferase family protein [unclassified Methylophaga]|jgi:peptidoglycan/LPS O-acetylase OafA/YrhL|uniref:acyltransferase family protein n=3 Tax=Methylophaga TaxID=40222 RepID=UPI0023B4F905|nr:MULTISPECIES: acyltransferase [unclassified Methylophaga]|tara:strand:- start:167 stop:1210 length:1044 start_codon:yes stop_codon:yes gene_type:complete
MNKFLSFITAKEKKIAVKREQNTEDYFYVLDGWRGISIMLVLAAHLLPLGPSFLQLNFTSGVIGMSIFFILSGFLITNFLIHRPNVHDFFIRRILRIIPLAWLYLIIAFPILNIDLSKLAPHFFFYANYPPMDLVHGTSHFWSLCVEIQFYLTIGLLFLLFREKAFIILVIGCFLITANRMVDGVHVAINTYYRVDEILAGVILSLVYNDKGLGFLQKFLRAVNPYFALLALFVASHPEGGFVNYFRPYIAAVLVGSTLYNINSSLLTYLNARVLVYLASVSYALYVIHPLLVNTWFGSGDTLEKYLKRPILFVVLFVLAHLSTFYYEKYWINLAKRMTKRKPSKQS